MLESTAYWLIGLGLAFDVLGCLGLVRLPDAYNRAQAATKCVTLGTCMVLLGTALHGAGADNWGMFTKALLCAAFILLTSPVGAHAICRAAYLSGVPLADVSVEDAFTVRAEEIRRQQAAGAAGEISQEVEEREEAETSRT